MASFSILSDEFTRLPAEKQNEEIGKLFVLLGGGIRISKENNKESEEDFRIRTFAKGLEKIPDGSEFKRQFYENRIIPSLIEDFKESPASKRERLMDRLRPLALLTDGRFSIQRESDHETELSFRTRMYSLLLRKLLPVYESEMIEFARNVDELDDESDRESDDEADIGESDDESGGQSFSTDNDPGFNRRLSFKSKGYERRSEESVSKGGSISVDDLGEKKSEPMEIVEWNDETKKAGFNPKLKFKGNNGPKSKVPIPTSH